jgi:hypothetical protein
MPGKQTPINKKSRKHPITAILYRVTNNRVVSVMLFTKTVSVQGANKSSE